MISSCDRTGVKNIPVTKESQRGRCKIVYFEKRFFRRAQCYEIIKINLVENVPHAFGKINGINNVSLMSYKYTVSIL